MDDSSSGYRFDAFLSYCRGGHWETFVQEFFEPILTHWLGEELGRTPVIFRDRTTLSVGQNWPLTLGDALRDSRVMITLWSRQYFSSEWCRRELGFMLARAEEFKRQGIFDRIVLPTIIHDGAWFPPALSVLQGLNLSEYADPFMTHDSVMREKLSAKVQHFSRDVASAIEMVPDDSCRCAVPPVDDIPLLLGGEAKQLTPPSLGGAR